MDDTENLTKHWPCAVKTHFPGQHTSAGRMVTNRLLRWESTPSSVVVPVQTVKDLGSFSALIQGGRTFQGNSIGGSSHLMIGKSSCTLTKWGFPDIGGIPKSSIYGFSIVIDLGVPRL